MKLNVLKNKEKKIIKIFYYEFEKKLFKLLKKLTLYRGVNPFYNLVKKN
jgi:hypothetical protein